MANDFYNAAGSPTSHSPGTSSTVRQEFANIALGFDKLPAMAAHPLYLVRVNAGGTSLESLDPATYITTTLAASTYLPLAGGTLTGNLGIGGAAAARLDLFAATPVLRFSLSTNNSFPGLEWYSTGSSVVIGAIKANANSGEMRHDAGFATYGGFQTFYTNGVETMRIDASGNVIIGATSRGSIGSGADVFSVNGSISFVTQLNGNNAAYSEIVQRGVGGWKIYANAGSIVPFRMEAGGAVGIGLCAGNTPTQPLDLFLNNGTYTATGNAAMRIVNANASGQSALDWIINGTLRGRIRTDFVGNLNFIANGGGFVWNFGGDSGVGTTALVIDSSGTVLVGPSNTSTYVFGGRGVLEINGSGSAIMALKVGNSPQAYIFHDGSSTFINSIVGSLNLQIANVTRANLTSAGVLSATGMVIGNSGSKGLGNITTTTSTATPTGGSSGDFTFIY